MVRGLALIQGAYFVGTGLWPLVHFSSFAFFTGVDGPAWSFRAIGLLIACIGVALLVSGRKSDFGATARALGATSAFALAAIDAQLIGEGVIGRLNLLDVLLQLGFAAAWAFFRPALSS